MIVIKDVLRSLAFIDEEMGSILACDDLALRMFDQASPSSWNSYG